MRSKQWDPWQQKTTYNVNYEKHTGLDNDDYRNGGTGDGHPPYHDEDG